MRVQLRVALTAASANNTTLQSSMSNATHFLRLAPQAARSLAQIEQGYLLASLLGDVFQAGLSQ